MENNNVLKGIANTSEKFAINGMICCGESFSYNLLDFDDSMVDLEFISDSLSKINRYTGHTLNKVGYSVGQHSVMMAQAALLSYGDVDLAMECLMHDSSEAYTGDIVKPLKNTLGEGFKEIEAKIEKILSNHFDVPFPFDKKVKEIDNNIAQFEMSILLNDEQVLDDFEGEDFTFRRYYELFDVWDAKKSDKSFLNMYIMLRKMKEFSDKKLTY